MNWNAMSDQALSEMIGTFIKQNRLDQNLTQDDVAQRAGISRSTLSLLERGETVTISTLIRVLRVLDVLHVIDSFQVQTMVSPLKLARLERKRRQRARRKDSTEKSTSEW